MLIKKNKRERERETALHKVLFNLKTSGRQNVSGVRINFSQARQATKEKIHNIFFKRNKVKCKEGEVNISQSPAVFRLCPLRL